MPTKRKERGLIKHLPKIYGKTALENSLEIFLPIENFKSNILIIAGIHGDEPESTALLSEAIRSLEPSELKNAVILCANPDGTIRSTRANANGVDLNRNFPASNWQSEPVYYRNNISEPREIKLSPGSKSASESETKALIKIINELKPEYIISIHGALACIEDPIASSLSKWIAKQTKLPLIEDVGYPTPGSLGSWAAENETTIITFELPSAPLMEIKNSFTPLLIKLLTNDLNS